MKSRISYSKIVSRGDITTRLIFLVFLSYYFFIDWSLMRKGFFVDRELEEPVDYKFVHKFLIKLLELE